MTQQFCKLAAVSQCLNKHGTLQDEDGKGNWLCSVSSGHWSGRSVAQRCIDGVKRGEWREEGGSFRPNPQSRISYNAAYIHYKVAFEKLPRYGIQHSKRGSLTVCVCLFISWCGTNIPTRIGIADIFILVGTFDWAPQGKSVYLFCIIFLKKKTKKVVHQGAYFSLLVGTTSPHKGSNTWYSLISPTPMPCVCHLFVFK